MKLLLEFKDYNDLSFVKDTVEDSILSEIEESIKPIIHQSIISILDGEVTCHDLKRSEYSSDIDFRSYLVSFNERIEKEQFDSISPRIGQWLKNNPVPVNSKINYLSNCSEYFFTFIKDKNPTFNSEYDNAIYNYPLCHGKERLEHPTQKPLGLIKDLIVKHSNKGDIVLDTFAGTSTTGIACIETERRFICVERDEKYYEISKQRIEKFI